MLQLRQRLLIEISLYCCTEEVKYKCEGHFSLIHFHTVPVFFVPSDSCMSTLAHSRPHTYTSMRLRGLLCAVKDFLRHPPNPDNPHLAAPRPTLPTPDPRPGPTLSGTSGWH